MAKCSSCGTEISDGVRFCSACGRPVSNTDDVATISLPPTSASPLPPRPPSSSRPPSSRSSSSAEYLLNEGRFLPGRLVASRYRIIALLGKGGMGEVYRADDLTLGQPVALKFLPDEAGRDEGLLERFRNEVRMARRVSHPNVCRVYDVGDVDGQTFFTMEYVDGEDLASLLRRIGRLPPDKALDIARHLCAGLAAAHAKGVLHRDLKPANIMLDGRGQVVITDFGLAGVADDIRGNEVRSGTPAYMSPEQLAGKEVSTRSDIYALGLVLYEVFTGKRAFAESPLKLAHAGADRTPSRPSSVVKDLDPIVEKVILRCLEAEPTRTSSHGSGGGGSRCRVAIRWPRRWRREKRPRRNWWRHPGKRPVCARELPSICLAARAAGLGLLRLFQHSLQRAREDGAGVDPGGSGPKVPRNHCPPRL